MTRFSTYSLCAFFILSTVFGTMYIRYKNAEIDKQTKIIEIELKKVKNEVRLMKIELAYLTSPDKLKNMVKKYLPNLKSNYEERFKPR